MQECEQQNRYRFFNAVCLVQRCVARRRGVPWPWRHARPKLQIIIEDCLVFWLDSFSARADHITAQHPIATCRIVQKCGQTSAEHIPVRLLAATLAQRTVTKTFRFYDKMLSRGRHVKSTQAGHIEHKRAKRLARRSYLEPFGWCFLTGGSKVCENRCISRTRFIFRAHSTAICIGKIRAPQAKQRCDVGSMCMMREARAPRTQLKNNRQTHTRWEHVTSKVLKKWHVYSEIF